MVQPGVLQIHTNKNQIGLSYVADKNLVLVHPAEPTPPHKQTLQEQAKKYKFTFDIENVGASHKLGALFKLGFCVLRVESDHRVWVESVLDRDGVKVLKGGDVENYEDGWAYLSVKKDLSNLERTVQWCILNDAKCKQIAENGKRFYASFFTRQFVYEYIATNLNAISSRQKIVDRTPSEEASYLKELSSACEDKLPALERHKYEITQPVSSKNTVVVIPYAGKEQSIALHQCLEHYKQYNVLIVEQEEGRFNRGALLNAAYLYTTHYFSEVENFVMLDPEAVFNTDFISATTGKTW